MIAVTNWRLQRTRASEAHVYEVEERYMEKAVTRASLDHWGEYFLTQNKYLQGQKE